MAPAIRVEIEKKHVDEAVERAKAGLSKSESYYYGDRLTPGLQLRVQGRQAFWALKYFNFTKVIGYTYPAEDRHLPSVTAARKLAAACKDILDDDPKMLEPMLVKYYGGAVRDVKKAKKEMVAVSTGWTVQETAEAMIEARTKPDTDQPIKANTIAQFRLTLRRPQVAGLAKKPIADVTKADLDSIKREMDKHPGGASMIKKFVSDIRSILTWGATHASDTTGLDPSNIWWELVKSGKKTKAITRNPTIDDLIKTLILAEEYVSKPLPGRFSEGKYGVGDNVLNSLWWLVLSAQRATAGTRLRLVDFFPDPKRLESGWYLAFWAEADMKNSTAFVLPVPPRAVQFLQERLAKAKRRGDSQWCFPSSQEQGTVEADIPVDRNSPGGIMERLAVRDNPSRKKIERELKKNKRWESPYRDLLSENGVMYWSPHDIRRALTEVAEDHGIPGGASAVLAHEVKLSDDLLWVDNARNREQADALRVARVTKLAYGAGQFIPLKSKAMVAWTDTILDRYEELSPRVQAIRALERRARIEPYIYKDVGAIDQAVALARERLPAEIEAARDQLVIATETYNEMASRSDVKLHHIGEAKQRKADAEEALRLLLEEPHHFLADQSLAVRGQTLPGIMRPDYVAFDFKTEAPEYLEDRKRYISGEMSMQEFKAYLTAKHGFTFSLASDSIYLPGKDPQEILQQAA
ncbi:hypothetical protein HFO32_22350 [Rhizobium leguminosarum]|uniref:hypothetical protein n=1 Tax=Rhizobium leguminosarum TaxID=384 RepID=UPI001C94D60B|nr:hypothetical protein [Rhizobium leguminosarum]MBY5684868.1 hypothetical protein [Rhizobium leguminosarum]